jgi:alkylhydroperoxidase family enzyme
VRFAVAREQGLSEDHVAEIDDSYEESALPPRDLATLRLTDVLIGDPRAITPALYAELARYFSDAEVVELALGVSLFQSLSKVLIVLGLEPEQMETTILPTPGSQSGPSPVNR